MNYHYWKLSYEEFERLAQEIISIYTGTIFYMTSKGRDGGIDAADNLNAPTKIIQAKHYINSKFGHLKSSLEKEVEKIKIFEPLLKKYYIFVSMKLNPKEKKQICGIFNKEYLPLKNIFDLAKIDTLLSCPEYESIFDKISNLWINEKMLNEIKRGIQNNPSINMDSDFFLDEITSDDCDNFIETKQFERAKEILDKKSLIFICGDPGVGKTLSTKMLALYFVKKGFSIRSTTNIQNIAELKATLNKKDDKEIIIIDDCLGQTYLQLKESQSNELESLIKYIKKNKSNKKIILNSRITILNEAKQNNDKFKEFIAIEEDFLTLLDLNEMNEFEKAKIFHNHLYSAKKKYSDINNSINEIKKDKNYWKIIQHKNFNPRLIEHITREKNINQPNYLEFITESFNNPSEIWKNEFESRINQIDRYFIGVIYSLSENNVSYKFAKKIFYKTIENLEKLVPDIDSTKDLFEELIKRLSKSFIKITLLGNNSMLSIANPSINDFLNNFIKENTLFKSNLIKSSSSINQYKRLLTTAEVEDKIKYLASKNLIDGLIFENEKSELIWKLEYISLNKIDYGYETNLEYINKFLKKLDIDNYNYNYIINIILKNQQYESIIKQKVFENVEILYWFLSYPDLEDTLKTIDDLFKNETMSNNIKNNIKEFLEEEKIPEFLDSYDYIEAHKSIEHFPNEYENEYFCDGNHFFIEDFLQNLFASNNFFKYTDFDIYINDDICEYKELQKMEKEKEKKFNKKEIEEMFEKL